MEIQVSRDSQQLGSFTLEQLRAALASGQLKPDDLGWHPGAASWQPLSVVISGGVPQSPRTEPLSIWSLSLGVISLFCCLTGIPAIVCGHIGLGKIKRNPSLTGGGMAIAGLIMGYIGTLFTGVVVLASLAIPSVNGALEKGKAVQLLNNARLIHMAMHTGAVDAANSGDNSTGWPVEAGITSVAQLKQMLVSNKYFTAADLKKLHFEDLLIGNVSEADPSDTIVIRSKPIVGKETIVLRKDGTGEVSPHSRQIKGEDPPRTPAYLEE